MANLYLMFLLFMMILMLIQFTLFNIKTHPIHMISILVFYTLNVCMFMASWSNNYIYPIMVFLMMISGLLIVFLYFSSISAMDNYDPKFKFWIMILHLLYINMLFILIMNSNKIFPLKSMNPESMNSINILNFYSNLWSLFSDPYVHFTLISILFLLLTLFTIIKICSTKNSSLRKIK